MTPLLKIPIFNKISNAIHLEVEGIPASLKDPAELTPSQVLALGATAGIGTIGRVIGDEIEITLAAAPTIRWVDGQGFVVDWLAPKAACPAANRIEDLRQSQPVVIKPKHDFAEIPIGTLISEKLGTLAYEGQLITHLDLLKPAHRTAIAAMAGYPTTARIDGDKIIVETIGKVAFCKLQGRWIAAREHL